jgi:Bacteriophage holin of superfamily 6 (Holin_LLH)
MLVPLVFKLAAMAVAALVPTTAALGLRYLGRRWSLLLSDEEFRKIAALAQEAVIATEQQYKLVPKGHETNREKLEFATSSLLEALSRVGIHIDRSVAEEKIEAAVYRLRSQA